MLKARRTSPKRKKGRFEVDATRTHVLKLSKSKKKLGQLNDVKRFLGPLHEQINLVERWAFDHLTTRRRRRRGSSNFTGVISSRSGTFHVLSCRQYVLLFVLALLLLIAGEIWAREVVVPRVPPEPFQAALMARYIIHNTGWVSIATISTQEAIKGYPFVSLKSLSDGTSQNSTGVPYLYMTEMDVSGKDIQSNNNVSIMATLAETDYCESKNFDPQDPRCAKVLISGKLIKIEKSTPEYNFGMQALFDKHPSMKDWPKDHKFYLAKVELEQIEVLDFFGGLKHVTNKDYFSANITELINLDMQFKDVSIIEIENF
ncbi:unnamed protein product [Phyllotreta striolata]|uniref:CREG-like beta-barrel domain-containing protein n=1 Tax=Phyllotreta striolata TaxID=444603 RepID=A0A9N9TRJ7_PHYSR|nr:unnamed protein product [Phyllotreta striolata]